MSLDAHKIIEKRERMKKIAILASIVCIAFLFRVWGLGSQDLVGDEAAYAFRSVGHLDYLGTSFQTQPIEWFKNQELPRWTKLSFHDHPPFGFLIQNVFFTLFGDTIAAARIPAALFGALSVIFIFLIAKRLFNIQTAYLSAAFFAITPASVWIFRTALLEPTLLFLILANIYYFLRYVEKTKWQTHYAWLWGLSLGLIMLTKYTGIFIIPVYVCYALLFHRDMFKNWRTYAAGIFALLLFSPVIVYNIFLFKTVGHFDLQIAYALGQETPEWTGLLGKTQLPFSALFKSWLPLFGPAITVLFFFGAGFFVRARNMYKKGIAFVALYIMWITVLLFAVGSADRFLILYLPAIVVAAAFGLARVSEFLKNDAAKRTFAVAVVVILLVEGGSAVYKNFFTLPDYGISRLDAYLNREFQGKISAAIPESDNPHLTRLIHQFAEARPRRAVEIPYLIVYNDNVALGTLQWIFYRRFFYHSVPTFFVENFNEITARGGKDSFKEFTMYFVQTTEHTLLNPFKKDKNAGNMFEEKLIEKGVEPAVIGNKNNVPMFNVYKFTADQLP